MTDIKELALRVATQTDDAVGDYPGTKWLHEYSKRFLAAYLAEREPVAVVINTDTLYDIRWIDTESTDLLPAGTLLLAAPPLP
jgi:hypothetical protein